MTTRSWADALHSGETPTEWDGEILIERREIGRLRLPSGRVVGADAMVEPTLPPFDRAVEPGDYPVQLAIAHFRKGAMVELPGQLNLALLSSGLGDGAYASYWGLDANDHPVVLLTDFGLLDAPEELRPVKAAKPWWRFW
jgi:Protein of unknown function (DUF4241)